MEKEREPEWQIELVCPFCEAVIVTANDFSMLPGDMSDEEREEITCGEAGLDNMDGSCEHLAFLSDWAYVGHSVMENWKNEMAILATALSEKDGSQPEGYLADQYVAKIIGESICDEEEVDHIMDKCLPKHDHQIVNEYVEKFDGVSCGGPTYMLIFLRKRS